MSAADWVMIGAGVWGLGALWFAWRFHRATKKEIQDSVPQLADDVPTRPPPEPDQAKE